MLAVPKKDSQSSKTLNPRPQTLKPLAWLLVKGFNLSYYNKEALLFTIDGYSGNLNQISLPRTHKPSTLNP